MTTPTAAAGGLFDRLMAVNREAFGGAHYSAAYHALAGALHCAVDGGDAPGLREVGRVAAEQGDLIEISAPGYEHSTASARARGLVKPGIYTTRAPGADARVLDRARTRSRSRGPPQMSSVPPDVLFPGAAVDADALALLLADKRSPGTRKAYAVDLRDFFHRRDRAGEITRAISDRP